MPTQSDSQAGYTLLSKDPVVVEDLRTEDRFSGPALLTNHDVVSGTSVIIGTVAEPWGVLGTHTTSMRVFTEHDVNVVQIVPNILASAIETNQVNRHLIAQKDRYHDLFSSMSEGFCVIERVDTRPGEPIDFRYVEANPAFSRHSGVSDVVGQTIREVVPGEDAEWFELYDRVVRTGEPVRFDRELKAASRILECYTFAVDGPERMHRMIDGLLAYSRVDTHGDPLTRVDLDVVLDEVIIDMQVRIEETDAEITSDPLPMGEGDVGQLRQVFQNLLDNAIAYAGDGSPRVHVSADRDGRQWVVRVRDVGIAIEPNATETIFEVFQRLHSYEETVGTGIGLALCQRIVERHGGDIWVDSEPGEGSTFSFTLPATPEHD